MGKDSILIVFVDSLAKVLEVFDKITFDASKPNGCYYLFTRIALGPALRNHRDAGEFSH